MFLKQTSYKPRSNSQSSTGSQGQAAAAAAALSSSPPKDTSTATVSNPTGPVSAAAAGRRRSSAAGAEKFAGLHGYKRASGDAGSKAAWTEQKPGSGGMLSNAWNSFTKGT